MVLEISALDTRDILVPVAGKASGAVVDPTADVVEMAFVTGEPVEADWQTASWETDTAASVYYAKCLVGPSGTVTLTAGTVYGVWLRIFDNPETVVARVGYVRPY